MEDLGVNDFRDMPEKHQALMVMVDELGELLSPTGAKSDEAKAIDELKAEAQMIIGSIARLGRAAGVHLVLATQRPDATLIPGEVRDNLAVRVGCGVLKPSASTMVFGSNVGQRIHSNPPGGMHIQVHGQGNMGQGFFAPSDWLEKYYAAHNLKPVRADLKVGGDDIEQPQEVSLADKKMPHIDRWDDAMDEIHGAGD